MDYRKNRKTRKMERGGDIHNRKVFQDILSIGYELETSSLSKFTLISETTEDGYPILMNTDTARKDLETLQTKNQSEEDEEEEEDDLFALRQEEVFEFDAYDRHNKVDKNVSFLVTNDIVDSPFIKFLNKSCREVEEEKEEEIKYSEKYQEYEKIDKDTAKEYLALEKADFKNTLYSFRTDTGKKYDMRFVFHDKEVPCGLFSDVEWIFTYYKPKQSGNIILETFANAIRNLLSHFKNMEEIRGKLLIDTCPSSTKGGESLMKSKESAKRNKCEIMVDKPIHRTLFHKPGTNLYYLQSHRYENAAKTALEWKDVCITPQMTFSAHISNIIPIMKNMVNDSIRSIPTNTEILENRLEILNKIEYIVNSLIASYNESATNSSGFVFLHNTPHKQEEYKTIKSYLFLIFYKLFLFYSSYHGTTTEIQYFKNALFFNSRHSNYILYDALKKSIRRYFVFSLGKDDNKLIAIIQKLCVQSEILEKHMVSDITTLRKNVFRPSNHFDKKNASYGNPAKSLISYFHFFEDPINDDTNVDIDDNIIYHDYLEYKRIDAYSAKMDLKNDIVLIEFRVFARLLASYIYSILEESKKEKMKTGICNHMTRNFQPDTRALSLDVLSEFDDHYHKKNPIPISLKKKSKSRSRSRSRSRHHVSIKAKSI